MSSAIAIQKRETLMRFNPYNGKICMVINNFARKPDVYFVLGSLGAGKSSRINQILAEKPNCTLVSSDNIQKELSCSREIAYQKTQEMMDCYVREGQSFVCEGTGQNPELMKMFNDYRQQGARIHVTYIDIPVEVAIERDAGRERCLGEKTVREVWERCQKNRHLWKTCSDTCEYVDYRVFIQKDVFYSQPW
jgi:predicted ABC-type ATPase